MGLFTRRGVAAATTWEPDPAGAQEWPPEVTGDRGCAGEGAYGIRFTLPAVPGAAVTVWFYAAHGPEGTFVTAWRYEYSCATAGDAPWAYCAWDSAPRLHAVVEDADRAALRAAVNLALAPRDASQEDTYGFFDWDGIPWAMEMPA